MKSLNGGGGGNKNLDEKNLWLIKLDQTVTLSFPSVVIFLKLRGFCGPSPGCVYYRAALVYGSKGRNSTRRRTRKALMWLLL